MSEPRERGRSLWWNITSLLGAALAVIALVLIGVSLVLDIGLGKASPYVGILTYLIYPAILLLGLLTIPAGYLWTRWRLRRRGLLVCQVEALRRPPGAGRLAGHLSPAVADPHRKLAPRAGDL
jgi:hypothetical protein